MIDFHCHILPGIDDGSKSLEESIKLLKKAEENGVTDISVSPHYIYGSSYNANNKLKKDLLSKLKKECNINLYYGNEVFVENNMLELLEKGEITTINQSSYLLFEIPMHNNYIGLNDLVFNLKTNGIQPIIAHPERYELFQKNPILINKLLEQGVLFQSNLASFYGHYGKEAKKLAILLLKHKMIHFICSDIHHEKDMFYENINKVKKILSKYISDEYISNLFENNARCVLENKKINIVDFIPVKKGLFGYK